MLVLVSKVFLKKLSKKVVFNLFQFLEDRVPESHSPTPRLWLLQSRIQPPFHSTHAGTTHSSKVTACCLRETRFVFFLHLMLEPFIFEHTLITLNFPYSNIFETNPFYIFFTAILMKRCSTSLVWNCYDFIMKQGFLIQRIFNV